MEFLVSEVTQGIKGFSTDLEQPWAFDVWESEQKYTLYAKKNPTQSRKGR